VEAMQANTVDVVGRMKEIAQVMKTPDDVLESHGVTTENIEGMIPCIPILFLPSHA
jgi:hsp70-interacting protein